MLIEDAGDIIMPNEVQRLCQFYNGYHKVSLRS
jgi:hypothetical protein